VNATSRSSTSRVLTDVKRGFRNERFLYSVLRADRVPDYRGLLPVQSMNFAIISGEVNAHVAVVLSAVASIRQAIQRTRIRIRRRTRTRVKVTQATIRLSNPPKEVSPKPTIRGRHRTARHFAREFFCHRRIAWMTWFVEDSGSEGPAGAASTDGSRLKARESIHYRISTSSPDFSEPRSSVF